jgi:hypothetical protein
LVQVRAQQQAKVPMVETQFFLVVRQLVAVVAVVRERVAQHAMVVMAAQVVALQTMVEQLALAHLGKDLMGVCFLVTRLLVAQVAAVVVLLSQASRLLSSPTAPLAVLV